MRTRRLPVQRYLLSAGQIEAARQRTHRNIGQRRQQYAVARADTCRSRVLTQLSRRYAEVNPDSCFYWLHQALPLARRSQHLPTLARVMHGLGYACLYPSNDEAKAARWFREAVTVGAKGADYACMAESYGLLSIIAIHQSTGNTDDLLSRMLS